MLNRFRSTARHTTNLRHRSALKPTIEHYDHANSCKVYQNNLAFHLFVLRAQRPTHIHLRRCVHGTRLLMEIYSQPFRTLNSGGQTKGCCVCIHAEHFARTSRAKRDGRI